MKVGRNQPCPCGSGKKFKRCHGKISDRYIDSSAIEQIRGELRAHQETRQAQQGRGKPIISAKLRDHQVVAVGKTLHWSKSWKTFPDFLADYLKIKMGSEWGNAEIARPLERRHPLLQWYDAYCRLQRKLISTPGVPTSHPVTGVVACYLGVAYGLYLLDHNVELQERLLRRLRDPGNFQGAYYELQVASAFILAGFGLVLEDETDASAKHCEFAAVSPDTGKKYWVEAKMRGVAGLLGRTAADGSTSPKPFSRMIQHINGALRKPANDERMIFVDLNCDMPTDASDENRPAFLETASRRLERYERDELREGDSAYVFVTNSTFHRDLAGLAQIVTLPFGLGKPDFNRSGRYRLSDRYWSDQRHADAYKVAEGLSRLLKFPVTFDGSSPSTLRDEAPPVVIGKTYLFEGAGKDGEDLQGVVTDALVMESEKSVTVIVHTTSGESVLLRESMSDQQLADYRACPDAYFGKFRPVSKGVVTPQDLFRFFMEVYAELPREELLKRMGRDDQSGTSNDDLLAEYCERLVSGSGFFAVEDGVLYSKPAAPQPAKPQ